MASIDDGYLDGGAQVNAMADVSTARRMAVAIEDNEARRLGIAVSAARPKVASRLKASAGTLENLRRDRLKSVPSWLMTNIRLMFVQLLQSEIRRLEHEISLHLQAGADHRDDDLCAAEAQVQSAKEILSAVAKHRGSKNKPYRDA